MMHGSRRRHTALDLRSTVIAGAPGPKRPYEKATAPSHRLLNLQGRLQTHRGNPQSLLWGLGGLWSGWGLLMGPLGIPEEAWVTVLVVVVVLGGPGASRGPLGCRGYLGTRPRDFGYRELSGTWEGGRIPLLNLQHPGKAREQ